MPYRTLISFILSFSSYRHTDLSSWQRTNVRSTMPYKAINNCSWYDPVVMEDRHDTSSNRRASKYDTRSVDARHTAIFRNKDVLFTDIVVRAQGPSRNGIMARAMTLVRCIYYQQCLINVPAPRLLDFFQKIFSHFSYIFRHFQSFNQNPFFQR